MTPSRSIQCAAFALALSLTLATLGSLNQLAQARPVGSVLAKATAAQPAATAAAARSAAETRPRAGHAVKHRKAGGEDGRRAAEVRLGVGVLALAAASSFASAMQWRALPPSGDWALSRLPLVPSLQPPRHVPLGEPAAHFEA